MSEETQEWYGVKGLFRWYLKDSGETARVEERVVIFRARNFDDALDQAEAEAIEYCKGDPSANFDIESMNWWNAFLIGEGNLETGQEVFSRLVVSSLPSASF